MMHGRIFLDRNRREETPLTPNTTTRSGGMNPMGEVAQLLQTGRHLRSRLVDTGPQIVIVADLALDLAEGEGEGGRRWPGVGGL